jgi:hypothetical protein
MRWLLYWKEKSPQYPLDRGLVEPQKQPECCEEEENILPLLGIESHPSSQFHAAIPTELGYTAKVIMTSPHFQLYCFAELSGLINSLLTPR